MLEGIDAVGLYDRFHLLEDGLVPPGNCHVKTVVAGSLCRLAPRWANIARILNVYPKKGGIAAGSDGDIVIWDPAATKTISAKTQASRIDYNVFEGFACCGLPRVTLSRGRIACMDRELRALPGEGRYVPRDPFPAIHVANATWRELYAPHGIARVDVTP
jgi:dihydropyrimidinase